MQHKIKIKGELTPQWAEWFDNFEIKFDGENTTLTGFVTDQSALHGILNKIRDLNLKLISVNPEIDKSSKK
jgi:hypothetical protein